MGTHRGMAGFIIALWFSILCSSALALVDPLAGYVTIDTNYGPVQGVTYRSQYEDLPNQNINVFRGIPYVKTLEQYGGDWRKYRFLKRDDEPHWYGTYDATKHKPACPQMPWLVKEMVWDFSEVAEDCLFLDIYTPNNTNERVTSSPVLYPVIVFFHGGGFIMGTSRQWPGIFLAQRNVVVVVVNFRLNALGFLSTGDHYSPGNYGMFDQVKALQFVRKNIRSFRGDRSKITIMGHSSGAASVGMHLLSPRSVDLFDQAIMLSGSELSQWAVIPTLEAKEYAKRLCSEVGCPTGDSLQMIDCLRNYRSFEQIVNASAMVRMLPGRIGNPWAPVVDGKTEGVAEAFLPDPTYDLRRQGRQQQVPLLAGMVQDEGAFFIPNLPNLVDGVTEPQFQNILQEFIRYRDMLDKNTVFDALQFQYTYWPQPSNKSFIRKELIEMMTDYFFGAAISESIRWHVQFSTVYFYVFQYSSWNNYIPQWRGISHGQDMDYIFGMPFLNETYMDLLGVYPRQLYDFNDRNMSEYMITMITNFTYNGMPTPRTEEIYFFRNVSWLEYNLKNHSYLSIQNRSQNMINYRQKEFHFWNDFYPKITGYASFYNPNSGKKTSKLSDTYELTTWGLTAACGVLLFTVICLVILLIRKSKTKKYPKYDDSSPAMSQIAEGKLGFNDDYDNKSRRLDDIYYSGRREQDSRYYYSDNQSNDRSYYDRGNNRVNRDRGTDKVDTVRSYNDRGPDRRNYISSRRPEDDNFTTV